MIDSEILRLHLSITALIDCIDKSEVVGINNSASSAPLRNLFQAVRCLNLRKILRILEASESSSIAHFIL